MNELYHHGVIGMKWGVRRYQNPDGTLTEKGLKRYQKKTERKLNNLDQALAVNKLALSDQYDRLERRKKAYDKATTEKKRRKIAEKSLRDANRMIVTLDKIEQGKKETDRLLKELADHNMTVSTKDVKRGIEYYDGFYYYSRKIPGISYKVSKPN